MKVMLADATSSHLPMLVEYMRRLRRDDPMATEEIVGFDRSVAAMTALVNDSSVGRVWVIRDGGEPAGYAALTFGFSIEFGGRTGFIDELFVDAAHRQRGVGKTALQLVTERAASLDVRVLFLELTPSNAAADRLYRGAGFVERDYRLMWKPIIP
jgi:ribosomal protein S18 acetylase RimI-like enzyme